MPDCCAVTSQMPRSNRLTKPVGVTSQSRDVVVKVTGKPEVAVAVMVKGGEIKARSGNGAKEIA